MSWNASVSGKRPAEPALPCMAGDQASDAGRNDEGFQHDGAGRIPDGLIK